jgi:hypothetical protein
MFCATCAVVSYELGQSPIAAKGIYSVNSILGASCACLGSMECAHTAL